MSPIPASKSNQALPRQAAAKPSLCVINYNGESCLEECLRSVVAENADLTEILVIDNGSEDGSLDLIATHFPMARTVALGKNLGPAAARNAALKQARGARVLLLDNDVALEPGCVKRLDDAMTATESAAVAMPAVVYGAQRDIVQYDGAQSHFLGMMSIDNENTPRDRLSTEVREIGSVISACILVDRSVSPEPIEFDESFFIYQEDHDFGYRTRALGFRILSVPAAQCLHGTGTDNLSIRRLGKYSKRRVFYLIRNRWLFLLNNYSLRTLLLLGPILCLFEVAQLLVAVKKGWLGVWMKAVGSTGTLIPRTLSKRRRLRRDRRVPDRDLLSGGPIPFRTELTSNGLETRAKDLLDACATTYWRAVKSWL